MMGALLGLMLPTLALSGFIFPIASMPGWLQPVTRVVPATWFIVVARGVMLKGVGLAVLWKQLLVLCAMAVVLLAAGARSLQRPDRVAGDWGRRGWGLAERLCSLLLPVPEPHPLVPMRTILFLDPQGGAAGAARPDHADPDLRAARRPTPHPGAGHDVRGEAHRPRARRPRRHARVGAARGAASPPAAASASRSRTASGDRAGRRAAARARRTPCSASPSGFERDLAARAAAEVQLVLNAEDGAAAGVVQAYAGQIVAAFSRGEGTARAPAVQRLGSAAEAGPGLDGAARGRCTTRRARTSRTWPSGCWRRS